MNFLPAHATNFRKGRTSAVKFIVVHYTANNGDTAQGNLKFFNRTANREASAHFFVDEREVAQSVLETDTAWHCGGGRQGNTGGTLLNICTNSNSIGIEMCSRKDGAGKYYILPETMKRAAALVRELMAKYKIPLENVVRHFDVTGKNCPAPLVDSGNWGYFKDLIFEGADEMAKVEFVGVGNTIKAVVAGKEIGAGSLVEYNGKTVCLGVADLLRELGHEVNWRAE